MYYPYSYILYYAALQSKFETVPIFFNFQKVSMISGISHLHLAEHLLIIFTASGIILKHIN